MSQRTEFRLRNWNLYTLSLKRNSHFVPTDRIPTEELKLCQTIAIQLLFRVPTDRIPTEELKHKITTAMQNHLTQVPTDRIPTEELKHKIWWRRYWDWLSSQRTEFRLRNWNKSLYVEKEWCRLCPNGQNSDWGIETKIIYECVVRCVQVPTDRIPTEELKPSWFKISHTAALMSQRTEFRLRNWNCERSDSLQTFLH